MGKFRKSFLIFGILALVVCAALGTFIVLSLTGSLKDEPIALEFTIGELHREYNGKPQRASKDSEDCWNLVTMDDGYLIEGHTLEVEFTGERTDVGCSFIGLDVRVVNGSGYDVSGQYRIKVNKGLLYVHQTYVNIKLTSSDVIYDGDTVDISDKYTASGLASGHRVALKLADGWYGGSDKTVVGRPIDARFVEYLILDGNGSDVTDNYSLESFSGSINILPRQLIISPVDAQKTYDGKPLSCSDYKITSGSLASGHYIAECRFETEDGESSIVNAGSISVSLKSILILDINDNDVTANYSVASEAGTVTVGKAPLTVTLLPIEAEYGKGFAAGFDSIYTIDSPVGNLALREDDNFIDNLLANAAVGNFAYTLSDIELITGTGEEVDKSNFTVTVVAGNLSVTRRKVSLSDGVIFSKEYDGNFTFTQAPENLFAGGLVNGHRLDSVTLDKRGAVLSLSLRDAQGESANDYYVITNIADYAAELNITPRALKISTPTVEKVYDGYELKGGEASASALTPLAYGDRIVTTKQLSLTDCNEKAESKLNLPEYVILNADGENVTEYYAVDAEQTDEIGTVSLMPAPLTVTLKSYAKEYGDEFVKSVYDLGTVSANVRDADKLGVMLLNSAELDAALDGITEVGSHEYTFAGTQLKIIDTTAQDTDEDRTANFRVKVIAGNITVTKRSVALTASALTTEYKGGFTLTDGISLSRNGGDGLAKGHSLNSATFNPVVCFDGTDAVSVESTAVSVYVTDVSGRDVSGCYDITNLSDKFILNVSKKPLAVSTQDQTKAYDGKPLYGGGVTVDGLAEGDRLIVTKEFSITDSTEGTPNEPEFDIVSSRGVSVKSFYNITAEYGTVKIEKRKRQATATKNKIYDAVALSANDLSVSSIIPEESKNGFEFSSSKLLGFVNVNTYTEDVVYESANEILTVACTYTITKRNLTVSLNTIYYPSGTADVEEYLKGCNLAGFVSVSGLLGDASINEIEVDVDSVDKSRGTIEVSINIVLSNTGNYETLYMVTGSVLPQ